MYERRYHASVLKGNNDSPKRHLFPWKRIAIITSCLLFLGGIFALIRAPGFQIRSVVVIGTQVADPMEVSQFVLNELQGTYLYVFPKTSVLLISTDALVSRISAKFPRFKSIDIDRSGMTTLDISVAEYPGVYLWCDADEVCSFMDETGTVFADAPYFSGSAYLKIYAGDRSQYPFVPVSQGQIHLVKRLTERLEVIDIEPLSFRFENDRKLTVVFNHHSAHASMYFDPTRDIDGALESLYSGLRTPAMTKLFHDPSNVLEYLDLRFSNKLIYKFR